MKKRLLSSLLALTMVATLFVGCGGNDDAGQTAGTGEVVSTEKEGGEVAESTEGKVLNVYCWNDEFQRRVRDHYAGYEEVDATHGKIGDIEVVWNITPSTDLAYQNNLDETLLKQADAAADDKIDIFLIEADYALKYVDTPYTMAVSELGITEADLANQYQYTKDIVTDSNGVLKGLSWQGCPGIMFYNREVAKEVLGTDVPEEVQAFVKDWDTFNQTAATMKAAGYQMVSSVNDTYRTYSNNVTSKWVVDGKINIDANLMKWVDDSKVLVDGKMAGTHALWGEDWSKGFFPEGKVFCYFGPAWLVNFSMAADQEGSIGNLGQWGGTVGPQGFFWGGTWICAATGTDNVATIKDIMLQLTTNEEVMKGIVELDDDFVNNKPAMEAMAVSDYKSLILGGQNPLGMYCEGAGSIDLSNLSAYDQGCNESFQNAMKNYFEGNATKDEALELFYKDVLVKYPELSK